ncbi:hypothetical protein R1flu_019785 [Riccia fluitans]|uniref:DUF4378 domain-containing protein n=1 Tax=Riccia fluitans TaxID=41844 RepID=A0ABD1ZK22_9MARC
MDLAGSSNEPWVDWVRERHRVLELLSLTAKMRIDGGVRSGMIVPRKSVDRSMHPGTSFSSLDHNNIPMNRSYGRSISFYCQQELLSRSFRQQAPQLGRVSPSKGQLNPRLQVVRPTESRHAEMQVVPDKTVDFADRKLNHEMRDSATKAQVVESNSEENTAISRAGNTAEPFAPLSAKLKMVESTPRPSDDTLESRSLKGCDRPTISWLNGRKENMRVFKKTTTNAKLIVGGFGKRKILSCLRGTINGFESVRKPDLGSHVISLEEEEVRPFTGSLNVVSDTKSPRLSVQCQGEDGILEEGWWSEGQDDLRPPDQSSECCKVDVGNLTRVSQEKHEVLHDELNQGLDQCLFEPDELKRDIDECLFEPYDPDEGNIKLISKAVRMERLTEVVLDSLVVDVAVEVAGICSSLVDNLIIGEFGPICE